VRPPTPAEAVSWTGMAAYPVCTAGLAVAVGTASWQSAAGWVVALLAAAATALPGLRASLAQRATDRDQAAYRARTDPPRSPTVLVPQARALDLGDDGPAVAGPPD
jgi:hypothetical protein